MATNTDFDGYTYVNVYVASSVDIKYDSEALRYSGEVKLTTLAVCSSEATAIEICNEHFIKENTEANIDINTLKIKILEDSDENIIANMDRNKLLDGFTDFYVVKSYSLNKKY